MTGIKKSWLLAMAICLAIVASFHGGHAFHHFQSAKADVGCPAHTNSPADSHDHEESSHSMHECCPSGFAALTFVDLIIPFATVALTEVGDTSFIGGMAREIDYPPQLV